MFREAETLTIDPHFIPIFCEAPKNKERKRSGEYDFAESGLISGQFLAGLAEHFEKNLETHCLESGRLSGRILSRTVFLND